MANKTINDLTSRSSGLEATVNIPVQDGVQTWRITGAQVLAYIHSALAVGSLPDAVATEFGAKVYSHGGSYNSSLAPTVTLSAGGGSLSSVRLADFIPYRSEDGGWRMKFNVNVSLSSTSRTQIQLAIAGVSFLTVTGLSLIHI